MKRLSSLRAFSPLYAYLLIIHCVVQNDPKADRLPGRALDSISDPKKLGTGGTLILGRRIFRLGEHPVCPQVSTLL
jgi:hypothetical protein